MKFGHKLLAFGTIFVFGAIYQHNLLIKLNYAKQRLELKKTKLIKEKNELMKESYLLKNPTKTKAWAREERGMSDLLMSHVVTLTTQAQENFFENKKT